MPRSRFYLFVPYEEKDEAKSLGAIWDKVAKKFYAPSYADKKLFEKWATPRQKENKINFDDAYNQFKTALFENGLIVENPIMDGKIHRCKVDGDKMGQLSGAYKGFLDQYPAGYIENFKSGTKLNWKYSFDNSIKTFETKEQSTKTEFQNLDSEILKSHELASQKLTAEYENAQTLSKPHPYLIAKKIKVWNLKIDRFGNLLLPLRDVDGKLWSVQRIMSNGSKLIGMVGENKIPSRKKGCFYTQTPIENHNELLVCEGFATAASVQELTNKPTIMAVDAGNLVSVCEALAHKYPNKQITIYADNDLKNEHKNVGLEAAKKCQLANPSIKIIAPSISVADSKNISDFNDLVNVKGKESALKDIMEQMER